MKKLTAVLLAVLLAFSLSAGAFAEGESTELPWPKYDTLQTVNLWLCSNYPAPDTPLIEEAINKISEERYNIHYNLTVIEYSQYSAQLTLALTSDNECDAFFNLDMMTNVKNGGVYDITDLFANDPNKGMVFEWQDRYMGIYYFGGRLYGLRPLNDFGSHLSLNIVDDVAEFYGIEPMTELSVDDVEELFAKIKVDFPDRYPIAPVYGAIFTGGFPWTWDQAGDNNPASGVLSDKGQGDLTLHCMFEDEDYIAMMRRTRDWYLKGYAPEDVLAMTDSVFSQLSSGRAATGFDTFAVNGVSGAIRTIMKETGCWARAGSGRGFSINSMTKDPELAYRALTLFWYDPELGQLMNNGSEGVTYTMNDNGTISYISGDPNTSGWAAATMTWSFPGSFRGHPIDTNAPTFFEDMYELYATAEASKVYGFIYDPEDQYDAWLACNTVWNTYNSQLSSGTVDVDATLAEAKQAWLDAGGAELMADKQAQLDAWVAANLKAE